MNSFKIVFHFKRLLLSLPHVFYNIQSRYATNYYQVHTVKMLGVFYFFLLISVLITVYWVLMLLFINVSYLHAKTSLNIDNGIAAVVTHVAKPSRNPMSLTLWLRDEKPDNLTTCSLHHNIHKYLQTFVIRLIIKYETP